MRGAEGLGGALLRLEGAGGLEGAALAEGVGGLGGGGADFAKEVGRLGGADFDEGVGGLGGAVLAEGAEGFKGALLGGGAAVGGTGLLATGYRENKYILVSLTFISYKISSNLDIYLKLLEEVEI